MVYVLSMSAKKMKQLRKLVKEAWGKDPKVAKYVYKEAKKELRGKH